MTLSLRARGALQYFVNSDMTISAARLAEIVSEGRDAVLTALKELRDAELIVTRKERVGSRIITTTYVTEKGFVEAGSWGLKSRPLIQHNVQNSTIQVLANSAINIKKVTIAGRLGDEDMAYDFFESTSSGDADDREADRLKAEARKRQERNDAKMADHAKKAISKANRTPEAWTVKDSMHEFADHIANYINIPPWKMSESKFFQALGSSRKKYGTNGAIEKEMMRMFFAIIKIDKQTDAEKLWKIFISRYSELESQARTRMVTPEQLQTAVEQAEDSWKGL